RQEAFDGRSGEVLAVDPQPVVCAAGEVDESLAAAVSEVAGPVDGMAGPGLLGVLVAPVALDPAGALVTSELSDRLVGVEEDAALVEAGDRAFGAGDWVEDDG